MNAPADSTDSTDSPRPDLQPGCYVEGHWGQYGVARVIEIAVDLGWEDQEATDLAAKHLASMGPSDAEGLTEDEFERLIDLSDRAEWWLNRNAAPEGFYFEWSDGEFFLTATNPYAAGIEEIPNPFGGVALFAVMDDGGILCESCVRDSSNPVRPADGDHDGWGVEGFDTTGNTDMDVVCDHCGRVLQFQEEGEES